MDDLDDALVDAEVNESKLMCKICYDEVNRGDAEESEWISPCKCGGSIKWVHKSCMLLWMRNTAADNRTKCGLCRFAYRWGWRIKPFSEWSAPEFNLTLWHVTGMFFDAVFTMHCFWRVLKISKSPGQLFGQLLDFWWWKQRVYDRKKNFYHFLVATILECGVEKNLLNAT